MAIGLEEECELMLGRFDETEKAWSDQQKPVEESDELSAFAAPEDDDFEAWIAETADVAEAARGSDSATAAVLHADVATASAEDVVHQSRQATTVGMEQEEGGEEEDDDVTVSLLASLAPREPQVEGLIARSLLTRLRSGRAVDTKLTAEPTAEPTAEVVGESPIGPVEHGEDDDEVVVLDELQLVTAGAGLATAALSGSLIGGGTGEDETAEEVRATLERELQLLQQEALTGRKGETEVLDAEDQGSQEVVVEMADAADRVADHDNTEEDEADCMEWQAEEEAGEYDPDVLLAATNAEVWDVDELDAQAEAFGATEAAREEAAEGQSAVAGGADGAPRDSSVVVGARAEGVLEVCSGEEEVERGAAQEASKPLATLQPKPKRQLKRAAFALASSSLAPNGAKAARPSQPGTSPGASEAQAAI